MVAAVRQRHQVLAFGTLLGMLSGCSGPKEVFVRLIDPCNRENLASVDYFAIEPYGTNIDSTALRTIAEQQAGQSGAIEVPLAPDFQIRVTGHPESFQTPATLRGLSAPMDLEAGDGGAISVVVGRLGETYRTTNLETPTQCSTLSTARWGATATYLPQSGQVLIVGGVNIINGGAQKAYVDAIELFDPATGVFTVVGAIGAAGPRRHHTATRVSPTQVLIAGGEGLVSDNTESTLATAFVIDASNPSQVRVGDLIAMREARTRHRAIALESGRVLFAGGRQNRLGATSALDHEPLRTIEIFVPEQGLFVLPVDDAQNAVELATARAGHFMVALGTTGDGEYIAVGGGMNREGAQDSIEVVRVAGDRVSVSQSDAALETGAIYAGAAALGEGQFLVAGGYSSVADAEPFSGTTPPQNPLDAVEVWRVNPATLAVERLCRDQLTTPRGHATVIAGTDEVVIAGGFGPDGPVADVSAAPVDASQPECFAAPLRASAFADPRAESTVVRIDHSGEWLFLGGVGSPYATALDSAEIYVPRSKD